MERVDESPFYEGHKIYIALVVLPKYPSSTRVICTSYLYKTNEAPISGQAFLTRWKVAYSYVKTQELQDKISKEEVAKVRTNLTRKLDQRLTIGPKIGLAFVSGADKSLDIKERSDSREHFYKTLAGAFSSEVIKTIIGNNSKTVIPESKTEVFAEINNGKTPTSTIQKVILEVFKDLIEEGNGVSSILSEIIDTGDEFDLDQLVVQLSRADNTIYRYQSVEAGEDLDDEALDEESRDRMMSRAASILTAAGVLGDPPLDYDSIRFEAAEGQELHDAAVSGALAVLKRL